MRRIQAGSHADRLMHGHGGLAVAGRSAEHTLNPLLVCCVTAVPAQQPWPQSRTSYLQRNRRYINTVTSQETESLSHSHAGDVVTCLCWFHHITLLTPLGARTGHYQRSLTFRSQPVCPICRSRRRLGRRGRLGRRRRHFCSPVAYHHPLKVTQQGQHHQPPVGHQRQNSQERQHC